MVGGGWWHITEERRSLEEALAIARATDDTEMAALALNDLGMLTGLEDYDAGCVMLRENVALCTAQGYRRILYVALHWLAHVACAHRDGQRHAQVPGVPEGGSAGWGSSTALALLSLGSLVYQEGETATARPTSRRVWRCCERSMTAF